MKARVGTIEVEGTVNEIADLIRSMQSDAMPAAAFTPEAVPSRKYVLEDVAFKALKRRPLSIGQIAVLKAIKKNQPQWTTALELQKATGYSPAQLAGLLGAFGKRVSSTAGYRQGSWFFDQEWDYEKDCNRYRLPEGVLAAVTKAGI